MTESSDAKKKGPNPTKYDPSLIPQIVEMGAEGATWNIICAKLLKVSVNTANDWVKKYPAFAEAREEARTQARAFWEAKVIDNVGSRTFNSRLAEMMLKALDPESYREPKTPLQANLNANVTIDLKAETDKLIKELEEAGKPKEKKK